MRVRILCIVLLFLLSLAKPANAQKVGLVLSGGGAKGLAHIGVIKALEENGIPINYVAGTSMGSVIGGMYAAGFSPSEMEEVVLSKEFSNWVNGVEDPKYNYYYHKRDNNASILTVDLKIDSTLSASISSNLASDQSINMILAELTAQASQIAHYNFDSLFVPFRAMAADIFTQTEVILKDGTLNEALRASLTVPLFYRPIQVKGKYLFDGGLYNNFPVDVMKDSFNPDVVIGSNVSTKKFEEYPYDEADKLVNSALIYSMLDNSDVGKLENTDIYLEPNLDNITAFDFNKAKAIIDSGYLVTIRQIEEIKDKISSKISEEDVQKNRDQFKSKFKPLEFGGFQYTGISKSQQKFVSRQFNTKKDFLTLEDVKKGYYRLISEDYFRDVFPNILYSEELNSFILELRSKPRSAIKLELGGNISTRQITAVFLEGRFYHFNKLLFDHSVRFYSGSFYQSAAYKTRISFPLQIQFYLEPELIYNHWDYLASGDFFIKATSPTTIIQIDRRYALNLGFPIGSKFKSELHAIHFNNSNRYSNLKEYVSTDTLDITKLKGFRYGIEFSRNSLNRKQYASSGSKLNLSFDYFMGKEFYEPGNTSLINNIYEVEHKWFRVKLSTEAYIPLGFYSLGYLLEGSYSNQPFFTNYVSTLISAQAFTPTPDSKTLILEDFRSNNYVAAGIRNVIRIVKKFDFRLEGYIFNDFRNIVEPQPQVPGNDIGLKNIHLMGTAGFVYHSPLGPISLSGNYYDDPQTPLTILLHLGYIIYNPRSWD